MEKPKAFRIPCNVEDFVPVARKSGMIEVRFYMADIFAIKQFEERPTLILPDTVKVDLDPRVKIMSGELKDKIFVIDPQGLAQCPIFEFDNGQYTMIPDNVLVGEITTSKKKSIVKAENN
jgi:hypothetical protein